ncbi:MAG: hypothetical protein OXG85_04915 [Chloroflexi bacterium]|nr:hypothetical protein [Chloroflexota bacterium]
MNRCLYCALAILAALALVACAPNINLLDDAKLQDTSLLSGEPCEAPCWNGITPGETSYRDAKLIIDGDARFKIAEESEAEGDNPGRVFTFAEGENPGCCQVISRDGETISSFLLQVAPLMTYGPVYDKYGEPTYAGGHQVSDEQAYVVLVYPELPLVIYSFVEGGGQGEVSVHNKIIGVMYMADAEMEQLLTCAQLNYWKGFQPLSMYVSGEEFDYVGSGVGDEAVCPTG